MKQRVTFYVDGFNFYYGLNAKKDVDNQWQQAYWIDIVKFFQSFLSDQQELVRVIYFTASPLNPDKSSRQSAFLNANRLSMETNLKSLEGSTSQNKYHAHIANTP